MKILVIIITGGDTKPYVTNLYSLISYMKEKYSESTVDYACITSLASDQYDDIIEFKYREIDSSMQLSKMCNFISKYSDQLQYDWFIKIRPEIELLSKIDIETLSTDHIHARAREYRGPRQILFGNSLSGEGEHNHINDSTYSNIEDILTLDDQVYLFHKNIIDLGGFSPFKSLLGELEREWTHLHCWRSRDIKMNIIGIDAIFKRNNTDGNTYAYRKSGNINIRI